MDIGWVVAIGSVAWLVGCICGTITERGAWTIRSMRKDRPYTNSAHYCNGKFYYIIEESYFVSEFQRKPDVCHQSSPQP